MSSDNNDDRWMMDSPFEPEPFRRDDAWHYTGHSESRVLVDPAWIELGKPMEYAPRISMRARYARKVTTPTKIEILYPKHLKPPNARRWEGAFLHGQEFRDVNPPKESASKELTEILAGPRANYAELKERFAADPAAQRAESELDRLIYGALLFDRPNGLDLLALTVEHSCDYLLSENPWLVESSEALRTAAVWIASPEELLDLLQLSLRSTGVFIEVVSPITDEDWGELGRLKVGIEGLGFSHFYPMENRTLQAYQRWFGRVAELRKHPRLVNHGRAAFYHRFPFMLYAHDQLRYHALYSKRFERENRYRSDHRFYVSYHLNAFYVMLAALLDNLAWMWSYALGCGFNENDKSRKCCVLTHGTFKRKVGTLRPDFISLLEEPLIAKWLQNLTLKRHPAVHREPLFLTEIYEEGTGKLLSDSASVQADGPRLFVFDLLGAADNDLKMLHTFLGRMESLPVPGSETVTVSE